MSVVARPTPGGRSGRSDKGMSAPYGYSADYFNNSRMHNGQDYYWLSSDPGGSQTVYAVGDGVVIAVYWSPSMGQCVVIDHGNVIIRYSHMPPNSSKVRVGDRVTWKTLLGPMGHHGTAAGGQTHLHMDAYATMAAYRAGTRTNPEPYFTAPAGGGTPIQEEEEETNMTVRYYERREPGYPPEWSRMGEQIPGGYEATLDGVLARIWGRQYAGEGTAPVHLSRADYIKAQEYWKAENVKWEARERARITDILKTIPVAKVAPVAAVAPTAPVAAVAAVAPTAAVAAVAKVAPGSPGATAVEIAAEIVKLLPVPATLAEIAAAVNTDAARRMAQ